MAQSLTRHVFGADYPPAVIPEVMLLLIVSTVCAPVAILAILLTLSLINLPDGLALLQESLMPGFSPQIRSCVYWGSICANAGIATLCYFRLYRLRKRYSE